MDEVTTMARAGENMGKAVGTGMRTARHGAKRAGHVGLVVSKQAAARADRELAQRGLSTAEIQDQLARRTTGMSRKELAKRSRKMRKEWDKRTKQQRKQLARNTEAARRELAARIDPGKPKHRTWRWVVLGVLAAACAAGVALLLTRRPEEVPLGGEKDEYPEPNGSERRADTDTAAATPSPAAGADGPGVRPGPTG
ncbi:hypothetical protein [Salinifilum ghardaiensis]